MRVVITGGPAVGKTTTINLLEAQGFPVVHEQATKLIKEGSLMPWLDRINFQKEVLRRQLEAEDLVGKPDKPVFLDRGLFDGEAYYIFDGLAVPPIFASLDASRYNLVLVMEELPAHIDCGIRHEDRNASREIARILEDCYRKRHVPVARIPFLAPAERAAYVLEKVDQFLGQGTSGSWNVENLRKNAALFSGSEPVIAKV